MGRLRTLDATAATIPRSAAGSSIAMPPATFTNTSSGDSTWTWDFDDGTGSTARSPTHTYLVAGTYLVTLTVSGPGGPNDTATHPVTVGPLPT